MIQNVIKRLEQNNGYDFQSEWWTDEQKIFMAEVVEACESVLNPKIKCDNCKKDMKKLGVAYECSCGMVHLEK